MQRWQADYPHAAERLQAAQTNESLTPRYTAARQFLAQGDRDLARQELTALWRDAPYYGDPAGLAKGLGLTVPVSIIDLLMQRDKDKTKSKQQEQRLQQKRQEEAQASTQKLQREKEIDKWLAQGSTARNVRKGKAYISTAYLVFVVGIIFNIGMLLYIWSQLSNVMVFGEYLIVSSLIFVFYAFFKITGSSLIEGFARKQLEGSENVLGGMLLYPSWIGPIVLKVVSDIVFPSKPNSIFSYSEFVWGPIVMLIILIPLAYLGRSFQVAIVKRNQTIIPWEVRSEQKRKMTASEQQYQQQMAEIQRRYADG